MARPILSALTFFGVFVVSAAPTLAQAVTDKMRETAERLIEEAYEDNIGFEVVESLTTEVGPRLAGSDKEEMARQWAVAMFEDLGYKNVRIEPFNVPYWKRGIETAEITAPFPQPLVITALGGSVATPEGGVEGEVVSLPDVETLAAAKDGAYTDKILFIDQVMSRTQDGSGYGVAVRKRRQAAYEGKRTGALGVLIRSVGTSSNRFAHTGQMLRLTEEIPESVPAAALSAPDADQLRRALERDQAIRVRLNMTPESLGPMPSGNVVAEIPGRSRPEEIVLIGAHLDSWDLGTGALDDGAGVGIVVAAAQLIKENLRRPPKRTIRIVLFGAEEVGLVGARAYAQRHSADLENHIMGAESDFGADVVWRFDTNVHPSKLPIMAEVGAVLKPLGIGPGDNEASGGPDTIPLGEAGVPVADLYQNGWDYFDYHHTPNDTLDKIDRDTLTQNVAA